MRQGFRAISKNEQVGQRLIFVQTADRLGQQRGRGQRVDLGERRAAGRQAEPRHGIGDDEPVDRVIGKHFGGAGHEQPVGDKRENAPRSGLTRGPGGAKQRVSGTDEIVDDQGRRPGHVADEMLAGNDARASVFFDEGVAGRSSGHGLKRLAEEFRPLRAAGTGDTTHSRSSLKLPQ